jgi:hypothetical protein
MAAVAGIVEEIGKKSPVYIRDMSSKIDTGSKRITDSTTIAEAESNGYVHLTVDEARQLLRNRRK